MLWLWIIHSSGGRADCRMSFCNFASGTGSLEHRGRTDSWIYARFLWSHLVCECMRIESGDCGPDGNEQGEGASAGRR